MDDEKFPGGKIPNFFLVNLSLVIIFIISFIYFYWFDYGLFFYQENRSLFIFSSEYLQKFTIKPGGLLEYAGIFLTQGYYNIVYGSLIISLLLVLFCIACSEIIKRLAADNPFSLVFILLPSCLLLLWQKHYDHLMYYNLGYLSVAFYFLFSLFLNRKRLIPVNLVLFPFFYCLVGSFALIYLGIYVIYSIFHEKGILRYIIPASFIITFFLTIIVFKEVFFPQPLAHLLIYPFPIVNLLGLPVFLYFLSGYIVLFSVVMRISHSFNVNKRLKEIIPITTILIIIPGTVFLLSEKSDPDLANINDIEKSVYNQDWNTVIKLSEKTSSINLIDQYYYNLALSEKGQLCDQLFFASQDFGAESLTLPREEKFIDKTIYFYYAIGLISEAHHLAVESMVINGYRPENLKLLIKTELINGNYKIAERFINILKKTLHYRTWSEKYKKMLYNPDLIHADPELGEKIRLIPSKDFFIRPNDIQNIELILKSNLGNKRAFEYKMARLLFEKDLVAVIDEVKKMKEIGYDYIPRHIEESILQYKYSFKETPDLGGLIVGSETESRFRQYLTDYDLNNKGNEPLLEEKMKNAWGNTYWYYYRFK